MKTNQKLLKLTLLLTCIATGSHVLAASPYTPPFYDIAVPAHGSVTVNYRFNPDKEYLFCFSNKPNLVASWIFHHMLKIGAVPIQLKKDNADSTGEVQLYNTDDTDKMINCYYQMAR